MRKVKARLLKFNQLLEDDDSDKNEEVKKPMPPIPPKPHSTATSSAPTKKRQSKWGKTSSSEPSPIQVPEQSMQVKQASKPNL